MARGWDRKPPSALGQLGQMLRGALQEAQSAIGERTRAGRAQIDEALLRRRHKDKTAALGEAVLRLVHAGRLDGEDFPELAEVLDEALASEERLGGGHAPRGNDNDNDDDDRPPWERPARWRPRQDAAEPDEPDAEADDDRERARSSNERRPAPWERPEPDEPDDE